MTEKISPGFEREISSYITSLDQFAAAHGLPEEFFAQPDHLAYKCADAEHYDEVLREWRVRADDATFVFMDDRRLASLHLQTPIQLGRFGSVEWLEVMEPRPKKISYDTVGIDHVEFTFPAFDDAEEVLRSNDVPYEPQSNPSHGWLNIVINQQGQELKLNDRPLAEIVAQEKESLKARPIKLPPATNGETWLEGQNG